MVSNREASRTEHSALPLVFSIVFFLLTALFLSLSIVRWAEAEKTKSSTWLYKLQASTWLVAAYGAGRLLYDTQIVMVSVEAGTRLVGGLFRCCGAKTFGTEGAVDTTLAGYDSFYKRHGEMRKTWLHKYESLAKVTGFLEQVQGVLALLTLVYVAEYHGRLESTGAAKSPGIWKAMLYAAPEDLSQKALDQLTWGPSLVLLMIAIVAEGLISVWNLMVSVWVYKKGSKHREALTQAMDDGTLNPEDSFGQPGADVLRLDEDTEPVSGRARARAGGRHSSLAIAAVSGMRLRVPAQQQGVM